MPSGRVFQGLEHLCSEQYLFHVWKIQTLHLDIQTRNKIKRVLGWICRFFFLIGFILPKHNNGLKKNG